MDIQLFESRVRQGCTSADSCLKALFVLISSSHHSFHHEHHAH